MIGKKWVPRSQKVKCGICKNYHLVSQNIHHKPEMI